jgi:hypothetical protein
MTDDLMDNARFWEKYGIARNLDLVDARAALERLSEANAELRDALDFAAQYRGNEGRSCPLCKYRDGVFIEACQMHKDMDEMMREVNRLRKKLGIAPAYPFTDEEMVLINEEVARQWRPIDFIELSDGLEVHVDAIAMTIGRGDTALATHAWPENGYEYAICRRPNNQKEPGGTMSNRHIERALTTIEVALSKANQLVDIACDWNLDEVEIDEEMVPTRTLAGDFNEALEALALLRSTIVDEEE